MVDSQDFADAICTDPEDIYSYMHRQVERDTRKKIKGNDIKERYADYRSWTNSKLKGDIDKAYNLLPENEEITVKDIKVSGLPAIQTVSITGGGSFDIILKEMGSDTPKSKHMDIYVVNGSAGYRIWVTIEDEQDYDTYLPTIQKMIDSFQIQGADNSDNATSVPNNENASTVDVILLSHKLKKGDRFGLTHLIGQIKNVGNNTVENVEIGLTGYDKNGDVTITKSAFTEPKIIKPNQRATFDNPSYTEDYKEVQSCQLSLKWNSNGAEQYIENATSLIQR
jgi:hypothetical protein